MSVYQDIITTVQQARRSGEGVDEIVLTRRSLDELRSDGQFTESVSGDVQNDTFIETVAGWDVVEGDKDVVRASNYHEEESAYDIR